MKAITTENIDSREVKEVKKPIVVKSIYLAYRLIEKGYLHLLFGVKRDKYNPKRRVWFFASTPEVQAIVDEYIAERVAWKEANQIDKENDNNI